MISYSATERVTLPLVEQPEEPEGGLGHPIQYAVYHLSYVADVLGTTSSDLSRLTDAIRVTLHNRDIPNRQDALFASMCKKFKLRDDSVPGLLGCKKPYACNEDAAYQATDYRTPDGILLVFACRADCSGRLRQCFGGYLLINNFVVNFSFQIDNLPIGEVPGADQELRRRLDIAEVKDFKWHDDVSLPDAAAQ